MHIFKLEYGCGFGYIAQSFYLTESGAYEAFKKSLQKAKKNKNYIRQSCNVSSATTEFEKEQGILVKASYKVEVEFNNENGHEFDEQDEFLTVSKIAVKP